MGKDIKDKELGVGITQQKNGLYNAGFVDKLGKGGLSVLKSCKNVESGLMRQSI